MRAAFLFTLLAPVLAGPATSEPLTIAVASNFSATARELVGEFESTHAYNVRIVSGSSGKLYAQIVNGAPFDVFLSADAERPKRLDELGLVVPGTRRAYAIGRLVLWSRDPDVGADCVGALERANGARVAIANPDVAPYGMAAKEYLERRGLWERLQPDLVIGENVLQAFLFAAQGGATFALTAASVVDGQSTVKPSCTAPIAPGLHAAIEQQAAQLARSAKHPGAGAFMRFLGSEAARRRISRAGYLVPDKE